ncbi:hypothetical protein OF83DRAFT_1053867 [Amylostereum chailletii]|nr:hypothetical protein OF83DRAFT_1053867 [Amylostereum chailletii]
MPISPYLPVSPLLLIPQELLQNIALELVLANPLGPPALLLPLLFTCRHIYNALAYKHNNGFYRDIFIGMFDITAAKRRFGPKALHSRNLANQLRIYCSSLQRIRQGDIYAPTVLGDFWELLFLAFENDGKNHAQLEWAGLGAFVDRFVRTRLMEGQQDGWPVDEPINCLALWLLWLTMDNSSLMSQTSERRQELINLILPFMTLAFRYPFAYAPDNHFLLPLPDDWQADELATVRSVHGNYPHYRSPPPEGEYTRFHFGQRVLLRAPPIASAAKLLYFSHREAVPLVVPSNLPVDRAAAIAQGHAGQTQADIHEVNAHRSAKLLPATSWDFLAELSPEQFVIETQGICTPGLVSPSVCFDNDWERISNCFNPWAQPELKGVVYKPGIMNGLWQGRHLVPELGGYLTLMGTKIRPESFGEMNPWMSTWPLFMRLKEHVAISPQNPVLVGGNPEDGLDDGIRNAWFPPVSVHHHGDIVTVIDNEGNRTDHETVIEGRKSSHNEDTCEICINRRYHDQIQSVSHADYQADFEYAGLPEAGEDEDAASDEVDYIDTTCSGIRDVIFTGETDINHGMAWGRYTFLGRVRVWDGLIALVRIPIDPRDHTRWVFRGYLHYDQVLVGSWRAMTTDIESIPWEGPFVASKRD